MIVRPERIVLDTWVLLQLSKGKLPECDLFLRERIATFQSVVIVTFDHVSEFSDSSCEAATNKEAEYVDRLLPMWMPMGDAILIHEAFAEYRRLVGLEPYGDPYPCQTASESTAFMAKYCLPDIRTKLQKLAMEDRDKSFSGKVWGGYAGDKLGWGPSAKERHRQKIEFADTRGTIRDNGPGSDEDWKRRFRRLWVLWLTEYPAAPPPGDLCILAERVSFERMPSWSLWMAVEKLWHRDTVAPRSGDLFDIRHLAAAGYADVLVTEKHMKSMITRAKLKRGLKVFADMNDWREDAGTP